MQSVKEQLILRKDDYEILMAYLRSGTSRNSFDRHNAEELKAELKLAKLVDKEDFPQDVVRLNSKVTIKEEEENKIMEIVLVTPDKADIKLRRISIMSPIGTALLGFQRGKKVQWSVPAGQKTFTIIEVANAYG